GEPFRQKLPTRKGIGGVGDLLGGSGTRRPVPIATAESIEFEFTDPDGKKATVVREIFDVAGKARRIAGKTLSAEEVREQTQAKTAFEVTEGIYGVYLTTGRVDMGHLANLADTPAPPREEPLDVRPFLRRINTTFAVASDLLFA